MRKLIYANKLIRLINYNSSFFHSSPVFSPISTSSTSSLEALDEIFKETSLPSGSIDFYIYAYTIECNQDIPHSYFGRASNISACIFNTFFDAKTANPENLEAIRLDIFHVESELKLAKVPENYVGTWILYGK